MMETLKAMTRGDRWTRIIVFNETHCYLRTNELSDTSLEEIETVCPNYSRSYSLMDSVFSVSHSKRGCVTEDET